ncbi:hypothetical protein GLOIN_2v1779126 [Rhizophagus irregularis DAOM 181602=DAOM 197198]|uniref:Uncharacterized protein n=1 Tax=Rhizophagus irregularis (strain DAOM 181602 / DAOM 197198 / MUCL 43194) TaxID=747089 RepID=A0A2P4PQI8_RHIID|nr:hypothetical protein GLOIN_2v1779126 [Rhizophagus irregularis DAOM 181602=DAOM 197198]POG67637.1 hypothetical protein GLOIN_2v1779126 [Rhizophagus irregularis DAOM 181602=DAOM 197198]|eukprot:XP_025174503.1 hypothetical protein GLOIN_2v1779126 [Rhizophagus irregularis DAOM 181602=DAOM 197198]
MSNTILFREEYLSAFKSKDGQDFSNYRERILSELLRLYKPRLFPTQLEALRESFEVSFQELVNATPSDIEILERKFDDQAVLTLEEQRELVIKARFECAFQRLKENTRIIVNSYKVMTELYHKSRGRCCGSKCRHCPFNHENVGKNINLQDLIDNEKKNDDDENKK